jgi:hypothetical protein
MNRYHTLSNLTLEQLRAIRTDIADLRNDNRDIKGSLAVLRTNIAAPDTEHPHDR